MKLLLTAVASAGFLTLLLVTPLLLNKRLVAGPLRAGTREGQATRPPAPFRKAFMSEEAPVFESQEQKIFNWRLEQFQALGFDKPRAKLLAGSSVDLNYARDLCGRCTSLNLAFSILA